VEGLCLCHHAGSRHQQQRPTLNAARQLPGTFTTPFSTETDACSAV
jgi:hypothetical protein